MTQAPGVQAIILYGTSGLEEQRKRIRLELMRWPPDKFAGKFSRRLLAADKDRILGHVNHISQLLNSLSQTHK